MPDDTTYSSDAALSGPAMLGLHLRAAVLEAEEAEMQTATLDRARARDQLRLRLGQLVDQRRDDLTAALDGARAEALATLDAARKEAEVIVEAATLVAASVVSTPAPEPPAGKGAQRLPSRAAIAMLALQLRAAERDAEEAERSEHVRREQAEPLLAARRSWQLRRDEMDAELASAERAADEVLEAARRQAAAIAAATPTIVRAQSVSDLAPEPAEVPALQRVTEDAEPTHGPVVKPMQQTPFMQPVQFAPQVPVNVVIDADAFARVFAAVIASALEERQPVWAPTAQMFSTLPVAPPPPVKQSFWSHAKHVDVLLLSAAMVIVLVVLAAWLV